MKTEMNDSPILALAATAYLDWLWYEDQEDEDGADCFFELYLGYIEQLVDRRMKDLPWASFAEAENYVTGFLHGFIQAMTDEV